MFIIIGAFLFGYCIGYYSFDIFKHKNHKHEIDEFFLSYEKKYGMQRRVFYLNSVIEKFGQEIKDCEVSCYLHRKSLTICCETINYDR